MNFAPIFFLLYNIVVVFVLLNVFIGIIGEAYGAAKEPFSGTMKDDIGILCKGLGVSVQSIFCEPDPDGGQEEEEAAAEDAAPAEGEEGKTEGAPGEDLDKNPLLANKDQQQQPGVQPTSK